MLTPARSAFILALLTLPACGGGVDLSPMVGSYHGEIVADAVVSTNYTVTVSEAGAATVAIAGADFATFEVDVMEAAGMITTLPDDDENTLSFSDGTLSVVHEGADGDVTFTGTLGASGGDSGDSGGDSGADSGDSGGDSGDSAGDSGSTASAAAEGDFRGSITGPVISADYVLTLTPVDATTVEASGAGITTFEIPLRWSGSEVEEAGTWSDGTFLLSGGSLSVTYDPQGIAFTGTRQ